MTSKPESAAYVWYSSRNIERAIARTAPLPAEEQAAIDYVPTIRERVLGTEDAKEGPKAFKEKRKPRPFKGR